jgi:transcriptional regulator with XRE-family HTH domain
MSLSRIRECRKQRGFTIGQVSRAIGCSTRSLIRWELGQVRPSLIQGLKLALLLDEPAEELFTEMLTADQSQQTVPETGPMPDPDTALDEPPAPALP